MAPRPHATGSFHLEIEGISTGAFVRCSGLGGRAEVVTVREGGRKEALRFDGPRRFDEIVLERGVVRDASLYEWFLRGEPRDGAVVLLRPDGREAVRWRFVRGRPCRWEGPSLDAGRAEVALERLEIAHEGVEWVER